MLLPLRLLGEIHLLPALPSAWKEGAVKGLKARGGFVVNINWEDHQLSDATIIAIAGGRCTVKCGIPFTIQGQKVHSQKTGNDYIF